jgi:hypothetical protein
MTNGPASSLLTSEQRTHEGRVMPTQNSRIEVSRVIDVPAELVFTILARPGNHVALDTSGMIDSSAEDCTLTGIGDVFVMNMRGGHQVENHVIWYEFGRVIGWAPAEPGQEPAGHTWTWRMTPIGPEQTRVSHTYDWSAFRHLEVLDHLPVINRDQMQESIERLADALQQRHEH